MLGNTLENNSRRQTSHAKSPSAKYAEPIASYIKKMVVDGNWTIASLNVFIAN